jgi:hypothetical protein
MCLDSSRRMATAQSNASASTSTEGVMGMMGLSNKRKERKEGDVGLLHLMGFIHLLTRQIGSVFASLSGEAEAVLPQRFLNLKRCV